MFLMFLQKFPSEIEQHPGSVGGEGPLAGGGVGRACIVVATLALVDLFGVLTLQAWRRKRRDIVIICEEVRRG